MPLGSQPPRQQGLYLPLNGVIFKSGGIAQLVWHGFPVGGDDYARLFAKLSLARRNAGELRVVFGTNLKASSK